MNIEPPAAVLQAVFLMLQDPARDSQPKLAKQ
jgi:hypothetical protein